MQMTKAAAVAILAYAASAAAYYPSSYGSIYARDAYPEAYAEAEFDFEDLYARDAEPEFDIHPRDAYMEGYEAGLYAREIAAQQAVNKLPVNINKTPVENKVPKPPTQYDTAKYGLDRTNKQESKVMKDEKNRESKLAHERKEFERIEAEMKAQRQGIKADNQGIAADDKAAEGFRKQMLQNQQRRDLYDYDY